MSIRRLLAATAAALMTLAGCSHSGEWVEVTGMAGEPYEVVYGQYVGEVFDDGPCADQQDVEGDIYRHRFAHGEDSGVPWVSDERVAGDYEYVADIDFQEDGDACVGYFTGTETMTNDGGTWEGTVEGTMTWDGPADTANTVYDIDRTMLGSGDYDGLKYSYKLYGTDFPWELTGTISPA
jgi:hypothetical protein